MALAKVKVAGRIYKIEHTDQLDGLAGLCDSAAGVIHIAAGQEDFEYRDTILHEVMHAILRQQGRTYTKAEELYVTALATGLLGVLKDNPKLVKELLC